MKAVYTQLQITDVVKINAEVARFAQKVGEIVVGKLIRVTLTTGVTNTVAHTLGAVPMGWVQMSPNADVTAYEASGPDATNLYLLVGATVTLTLWIF